MSCRYQDGDFNVDVDGGDPIRLGGEIVLCSRDNVTSERHYSGSLAHLSLFDTTLNTQQISELYQAVPLSSAGSSETDAATTELGTSMWLNQFSNNSFLQARPSTSCNGHSPELLTCFPGALDVASGMEARQGYYQSIEIILEQSHAYRGITAIRCQCA